MLGLLFSENPPAKCAPWSRHRLAPYRSGEHMCTPEPTFSRLPDLRKDHSADVCGQIGEPQEVDDAVTTSASIARRDGNTLVIVTADHAREQVLDGATPGLSARLVTKGGSEMIVAHATAPAGRRQQHTSSQVRVAGYGPGAADVVDLTDQTDLFFVIRKGHSLR